MIAMVESLIEELDNELTEAKTEEGLAQEECDRNQSEFLFQTLPHYLFLRLFRLVWQGLAVCECYIGLWSLNGDVNSDEPIQRSTMTLIAE